MARNSVAIADDTVIPVSKRKCVLLFALLMLCFIGGIALIWAWWTDTPIPYPLVGEPSPRWSGMTGLFLSSIAGIFLPVAVVYYFAYEKLILRVDRLQIVQHDKVVAQILYRNIAKATLTQNEGVPFLGIDLQGVADLETFAEGCDFAANKSADGWHYAIQDVYDRQLHEILHMIEERLESCRPT